MPNQIHGHDVMHMMLEHGQSYTKETLRTAIVDRFGAETRFHTCSAEDLTASELVEFLAQQGKFVETVAGFTTAPEKICDH
ncbi:MAG: YecH family protein [Cyanothece sp. SIO2G6]|nr:YecH family protein [Cyanothece sp. SIO2G6]